MILRSRREGTIFAIVALMVLSSSSSSQAQAPQPQAALNAPSEARPPVNRDELRFWLENMVWHHQFTTEEIREATGLSPTDQNRELTDLGIRPDAKPNRAADAPLLVLPYPGGRHPRQGFLDGAIRPQRETKLSVFAPWDQTSYAVIDVPEAVFSNLGLTYLAHTHVPTLWSKQGIDLPRLEWTRNADGSFQIKRELPNKIGFEVKAVPNRDAVALEMSLTNGTDRELTGLRVQMCAMLKKLKGFEPQSNDNKVFRAPYSACKSADGKRWVIWAWEPCQRAWGNAPCPCLHSDPQFPDCPPGQTRHARGWFSFYEGADLDAELARVERTNWRGFGVKP